MKKIFLSTLVILGFAVQAQELPMPSPSSALEQRVGLTDIKIEYSRPGVKERKIFGELVPYGKVWRTGANKVPNITFSTDLKVGGNNVKAGTYSLLTIPTAESWTIVLNSNTELYGTAEYDEGENVAVVEVMTAEALPTESFTIDVNDITTNSANIALRWEKTEVKVPVEVEVHPVAMQNIESAIAETAEDELWRVYRNAANYYYNNKLDIGQAQTYMEKSLNMYSDSWFSHWLNAEILAEKGEYKSAIKSAKESIKVGEAAAKSNDSEFSFTDMIEEGIAKWSEMK